MSVVRDCLLGCYNITLKVNFGSSFKNCTGIIQTVGALNGDLIKANCLDDTLNRMGFGQSTWLDHTQIWVNLGLLFKPMTRRIL